MSFRARCPSCQKHATAPDNALGKKLRCPSCQVEFVVARDEKEPTARVIWEYIIEDLEETIDAAASSRMKPDEIKKALIVPIEKRVNVLGAEGWELTSATYCPAESQGMTEVIGFWKMIFKRPKHAA